MRAWDASNGRTPSTTIRFAAILFDWIDYVCTLSCNIIIHTSTLRYQHNLSKMNCIHVGLCKKTTTILQQINKIVNSEVFVFVWVCWWGWHYGGSTFCTCIYILEPSSGGNRSATLRRKHACVFITPQKCLTLSVLYMSLMPKWLFAYPSGLFKQCRVQQSGICCTTATQQRAIHTRLPQSQCLFIVTYQMWVWYSCVKTQSRAFCGTPWCVLALQSV